LALTDEDKAWISNTVAELLRPTNSRLDSIDRRLDAVGARFDRQADYLQRFRSEIIADSMSSTSVWIPSQVLSTGSICRSRPSIGQSSILGY
jgi:hypothetical protein